MARPIKGVNKKIFEAFEACRAHLNTRLGWLPPLNNHITRLKDRVMRIATWNINSVRLRLPAVLRFLQEQPDILCLQETKTEDKTSRLRP